MEYNPKLWKFITDWDESELNSLIEQLKHEKLLEKYLSKGTRLSGSSTTVYPIEVFKHVVWQDDNDYEILEIVFELTADRNVFDKTIENIVEKYDNIVYGEYRKKDGSCPNTLVFFTNFVIK